MFGDLAIGVDPDGADAWVWQDVLAPGVRVGAPPDEFNAAGQDWGLPPFVPWRLRAARVRAARARRCGPRFGTRTRLRIDHVMGLFRLYWIPEGRPAADGGYVRYPGDELLDIIAFESAPRRCRRRGRGPRHGRGRACATSCAARRAVVPAGLVRARATRRVPRAGARRGDDARPADHRGAWTGADVEDQRDAGVKPNLDAAAAQHDRLRELTGLDDGAPVADVVLGTYRRLAGAPSRARVASLDDALGVEERPNLPGTTDGRPNWSLALPVALEAVTADPQVLAVAAVLDAGSDARAAEP